MYHDVYFASVTESGFQTDGANHYKVCATDFEQQVHLIKDLPITLSFDDGGVSFYTVIAPILERNNIRGHFFIATDYIGTDGFLNEEQIKDLHQRGHVIGSHSCSHPSDFRIIPFENRKMEWVNSVRKLSEIIGKPLKEVSIPNGFLQEDDLQVFKTLGISTIYTSKLGESRVVEEMAIIGRIGIDNSMSPKKVVSILSGGFLYKTMLFKQYLLSFIKFLLGNRYIKVKAKIRKVSK